MTTSTSTKSQKSHHPLSERHFRQIVCRDRHLTNRMRGTWGVTWRPGDQTGHFIGKLFRPFGSAVMMVQVPYDRPGDRPGLGLFGVAGMLDPTNCTVYYADCRLKHEFHFVPRPGARGTVLDPSSGRHGNESWVQRALEVDHVRQRMTERNFMLPAVPDMPVVFFGYASREHALATFAETSTLRQLAVGNVEINWQGDSLSQLSQFSSESATQREAIFARWPKEMQQTRMQEAFAAALLPPGDINTTGLWLVPHALATDPYRTTRIFEYFGGLIGAQLFNPARKMTGKTVPNPAVEVAKAAGIDLVKELAAVEATAEGDPLHQDVEVKINSLLPAYRQVTGASTDISDENLLHALCAYEEPVLIELPLAELPEAAQIQELRQALRPHISEGCTDDDILNAVRNPLQSLYASGLPTIQVLRRDPRIPLADSMSFTPEVLGRERVAATFWYDLPTFQPKAKTAGKRAPKPAKTAAVAEPPEVVTDGELVHASESEAAAPADPAA